MCFSSWSPPVALFSHRFRVFYKLLFVMLELNFPHPSRQCNTSQMFPSKTLRNYIPSWYLGPMTCFKTLLSSHLVFIEIRVNKKTSIQIRKYQTLVFFLQKSAGRTAGASFGCKAQIFQVLVAYLASLYIRVDLFEHSCSWVGMQIFCS